MKRIISLFLIIVISLASAVTIAFAGAMGEPARIGSFRINGFTYEFYGMDIDEGDEINDYCYISIEDYWGSTLVNKQVFPNGAPVKSLTMKQIKSYIGEKQLNETFERIPLVKSLFDDKYANKVIDTKMWGEDYDCVVPYSANVNVTIKCVKNGNTAVLQFPDQKPVIANGTTLLPIRAVADFFGWSVNWDANTRKVTVTNGVRSAVFKLGSKYVSVNNAGAQDLMEIPVPADVINSRTVVPVRAVSECLGAKVGWDSTNYVVTITQ